jgi:hypothetical protein
VDGLRTRVLQNTHAINATLFVLVPGWLKYESGDWVGDHELRRKARTSMYQVEDKERIASHGSQLASSFLIVAPINLCVSQSVS